METHRRSIAKTFTWRMLATVITASVAWVATGKLHFAITIGLADTILKLGVYYLHERAWDQIGFGRAKLPDYQI